MSSIEKTQAHNYDRRSRWNAQRKKAAKPKSTRKFNNHDDLNDRLRKQQILNKSYDYDCRDYDYE